ncbi:MAG: ribosome biogenesis protein [Candidatus Thermoplasmatota archaeon]|nr:ribosome biogenesis protein [Candidatus Thermoplasmatota archaeon]
MKGTIRKCDACGIYTMELKCPKCSEPTRLAGPIKYSTTDRFQKFRLEEMEEEEDGEN